MKPVLASRAAWKVEVKRRKGKSVGFSQEIKCVTFADLKHTSKKANTNSKSQSTIELMLFLHPPLNVPVCSIVF